VRKSPILRIAPPLGAAGARSNGEGAEVVRCKRSIDDPMDAIHDTADNLEEVF
jgi:hypothetical protein